MIKSFDGGKTWTRPVEIMSMNDACFFIDPVSGRCVADGIAGARIDLAAMPSVDIANGAPNRLEAAAIVHRLSPPHVSQPELKA